MSSPVTVIPAPILHCCATPRSRTVSPTYLPHDSLSRDVRSGGLVLGAGSWYVPRESLSRNVGSGGPILVAGSRSDVCSHPSTSNASAIWHNSLHMPPPPWDAGRSAVDGSAQHFGQLAKVRHKRCVLFGQERLRPVRQRLLRAVVDLDVNAIGLGGHGGHGH